MARISVVNHLTLDGVMQAPGRPDEDTRGGFTHGGWSVPYGDEVMGRVMGEGMAKGGALLLGRRTYEDFAAFWPTQAGNPISELLEQRQKYVVSSTLREPLPWLHSTVLNGDPVEAVAELKRTSPEDLAILGSGMLVQALVAADLVDELLLTIHPLVLGRGRRLFPEDGPSTTLELVEVTPTTTGVLIARYRRPAPGGGTGRGEGR